VSPLSGFSKLSSPEKLSRLVDEGYLSEDSRNLLITSTSGNPDLAGALEKMTENVISAFPLPYSVAPGFLINGRKYVVPMVTEESSVVAAASWSARYWSERGGFQSRVISATKVGQIHFIWTGGPEILKEITPQIFEVLKVSVAHLTKRMEHRGGGITGIELIDFTDKEANLYQIRVSFLTADSMGANHINGCLEVMSTTLQTAIPLITGMENSFELIMSILSNHTPECRVACSVECKTDELTGIKGANNPETFARRFAMAVRIAHIDPFRAVTHNKGIYNGIDAVVMATANDARAVEAAGHAYAARSGTYASLTNISLENGLFRYTLEVPMALGTVGGLTRSHPLAAISLGLLGNPSAEELMKITAATGLANNFAALKTLVTTGIQAGHMPLHDRKNAQ
jgi:hydroxymethylglutaryl-CoA reductase